MQPFQSKPRAATTAPRLFHAIALERKLEKKKNVSVKIRTKSLIFPSVISRKISLNLVYWQTSSLIRVDDNTQPYKCLPDNGNFFVTPGTK